MKSKTPSEMRYIHEQKGTGLFFSAGAMRHMNDTMKSFGARIVDGQQVLYRKPRRDEDGHGGYTQMFNCWIFNEETGAISPADKELKQKVWEMV